jgi:hypothetical protein
MRIARFGDNRLGLVDGYVLRDITQVTERLPQYQWPFPKGDQFIANLDLMRRTIKSAADAAARVPVTELKLLSPVANPAAFALLSHHSLLGLPHNGAPKNRTKDAP